MYFDFFTRQHLHLLDFDIMNIQCFKIISNESAHVHINRSSFFWTSEKNLAPALLTYLVSQNETIKIGLNMKTKKATDRDIKMNKDNCRYTIHCHCCCCWARAFRIFCFFSILVISNFVVCMHIFYAVYCWLLFSFIFSNAAVPSVQLFNLNFIDLLQENGRNWITDTWTIPIR